MDESFEAAGRIFTPGQALERFSVHCPHSLLGIVAVITDQQCYLRSTDASVLPCVRLLKKGCLGKKKTTKSALEFLSIFRRVWQYCQNRATHLQLLVTFTEQ